MIAVFAVQVLAFIAAGASTLALWLWLERRKGAEARVSDAARVMSRQHAAFAAGARPMTRLIAIILDVAGGALGFAMMLAVAAFFATGGEVVFWIWERLK